MTPTFNAAAWLVDRQVEQGRGDHVAVRSAVGVSRTYADLADDVAALSAGLRGLGLRRDDRVVFVTADDLGMFTGILACFRAGVVAVPVSTMLGGRELGEIVADSGAQVVVVSVDFVGPVQKALTVSPAVRTVLTDGHLDLVVPAGVEVRELAAVQEAGRDAAEDQRAVAATSDDSWALWLYTSGTTGTPKGAMHRHANIRHVCETYGDQVLGITPDDVGFSVAKLFFAYGIGNSLFFPLSVGATSVLESRRPTTALVGERVRTERPTLFYGVPTFFAALLASDLPDDTFASVRLATSAGEPLPAALLERFRARFGVDIIDGIGSTEELHIFLSNRPGHVRPGTTGQPVPGYDIALRDVTGALVTDGEPGQLYVRGESMALGYWRRTDASRTVFQGEWLSTGDTYVRSADGYYTCLGRSNDLIKAGGIWVSPSEVEARLLQHPGVLEAAVIGVPDPDGLDKPVAAVVLVGGPGDSTGTDVTGDELVGWCRDGLAHFKAPRQVVVVDELPKTATGKMQRYKVRQLFSGTLLTPSTPLTASDPDALTAAAGGGAGVPQGAS